MCHFAVNENYSHHPSHHHNLGHTWLPTLDFGCTQEDRKGPQTDICTQSLKTALPTLDYTTPEQVVDLLNSHWFRVWKCVSWVCMGVDLITGCVLSWSSHVHSKVDPSSALSDGSDSSCQHWIHPAHGPKPCGLHTNLCVPSSHSWQSCQWTASCKPKCYS